MFPTKMSKIQISPPPTIALYIYIYIYKEEVEHVHTSHVRQLISTLLEPYFIQFDC